MPLTNLFGFFTQSQKNYETETLKSALKQSFQNLKIDIQNLQSWIDYLHQNQQQNFSQIAALNTHIRNIAIQKQLPELDKEHIKQVVDYYYDFEDLITRVNGLEKAKNNQDNDEVLSEIKLLKGRLEALENKPKRTYRPVGKREPRKAILREKIIKQLTSKSKEYVKNLIISLITKYGNISALKLREIVIDEQGLCSKSSFYRILDEIEKEQTVSSARHGKEKTYAINLTKMN